MNRMVQTRSMSLKNSVYRKADEENKTYLFSKKYVRNCPRCEVAIFKFEGCPKMICPMCKSKFCFYCLSTETCICVEDFHCFYDNDTGVTHT